MTCGLILLKPHVIQKVVQYFLVAYTIKSNGVRVRAIYILDLSEGFIVVIKSYFTWNNIVNKFDSSAKYEELGIA